MIPIVYIIFQTMTTRYCRDENNDFILGENGKKLRYLFYKKDKKIIAKNKNNWTDEAIDRLEIMYENICSSFIYEEAKPRGRPKKNGEEKHEYMVKRLDDKKILKTAAIDSSDDEEVIKYDFGKFTVGNRVEHTKKTKYGKGEIIKLDINNEKIVVRFDSGEIYSLDKSVLKKVRGRKPTKIKNIKEKIYKGKQALKNMSMEEKVYDSCDDDDLEMFKYEGKVYLINSRDEVSTMNGDYIGVLVDGELQLF